MATCSTTTIDTTRTVNAPGFNPIMLPDAREHPLFYVGVYAMTGFGVMCAAMRWYDVTPAGRMLNR
jgi:hypothetical protein